MNDRSGARLVKLSDSSQILSDPGDDIRGAKVVDRHGEEIGKLVDLLLDEEEGKVRMVQIEEGGVLGIGATVSFLPVDAITSISEDEVHVDQTRGRIAEAPLYDPELTDQSAYYSGLYEHYGYAPYWGAGYVYSGLPFTGRF